MSRKGQTRAVRQGRWMMIPALMLILAAGVCVILWFGAQKQGFHEDEIYSYYSSNRTAGIAWPDREWMDTRTMTDEFVVLPGEGFRFGLVKTVQSWDVHPPLYYDLLHAACSFYPGLFSKWLGIGVNLIAYVLCFLMLVAICRECRLSDRFTAFFLFLWAIHPLTVSAAMFVRMYFWLTFFVLSCLFIHLRMLRGFTRIRMAALMLVSFLGFLTHYYYVVFFFFTGLTMSLLWFLQKTADTAATDLSTRLGRIVRYVFCCGVAIAAAVLYYPACLGHIFRGYRGREAAGAFLALSGWGTRLAFFGSLINEYLFSGALPVLLFLYLVFVLAGDRRAGAFRLTTVLTVVPTVGYFFVVSATALILGSTSNRYLLPVDPLILLVIFATGSDLLKRMIRTWKPSADTPRAHRSEWLWRGMSAVLPILFGAMMMFLVGKGLVADGHVLFLYPENAAAMEEAETNRDTPVLVLYNGETTENIWQLYDKLKEFPRVYFADAANGEPFEDPTLLSCPKLYVFAADTADNIDRDLRLADLVRLNPKLSGRQTLYRQNMWTWYRLE
ncbi:MAG: hypothetical protein K5696_07390 [Lachnospiraceae bacterium]|nr:hypothetical protein [Lachnospiraceae bacterium]